MTRMPKAGEDMITPEQILSALIRLQTVNPPGNEILVARFLKQLFENAGIPCEIIEPEPGRASFIGRLGAGAKKLLFLSHADVVEAGDGWDFNPFSGEIKDGMVYGRGALDCKGLIAAQVYAFLQLAREKVSLDGELILAVTADEEAGGALGLGYIMKHCPEKIRADFAVNEGADYPITISGNRVSFIQVGEKGVAWAAIHTSGTACHGSVPGLGDNALVKTARAVNALASYRPEIILIPEVKALLTEMVRLQGLPMKVETGTVNKILDSLELDRSFTEILRAMTAMTVSPNVIRGGNKINIVPDYCRLETDSRILPGQDRSYVQRELRNLLGEEMEIELTLYQPPTFSPSQADFYSLLEATITEIDPGTICLPYISSGSTDSKHLRTENIPAYGIGLLSGQAEPELRATIHGKNERIKVDCLHFQAEFFTVLARSYLT